MNIVNMINNPRDYMLAFLMKNNRYFSDTLYLKLLFRLRMGYPLNLEDPKSFQEKLQWLKLYNRKAILSHIVDKIEAKLYAADRIGEKYIIPTLGVWNNPDEIDFSKLPQRFVLKTTDGGGSTGVIICKDKTTIDEFEIRKKLWSAMTQDIYGKLREWPYKNVEKRILAEELMSDESESIGGDLKDYKFYCFNGVTTFCEVISGRRSKKAIDFFDLDWNHIDFCFDGYGYYEGELKKPVCFDEMIKVSNKLCAGLPFARVDLYEVNGKVYFGEVTLYPASGFRGYYPKEWNRRLGDMITIKK